MLNKSLTASRILIARPLRPPNRVQATRLFTQNSQLYLVAPHSPRPHLAFLSAPSFRPRPIPFHQFHLRRLLSTETKKYWFHQWWLATKWFGYTVVFFTLGSTMWFGYTMSLAELENPTPPEFPFIDRQDMRMGRMFADPSHLETKGFIDYAQVGSMYRNILDRLEDRSGLGRGLEDGGAILVPGVGAAGLDYRQKSYAWRAGYFEACMAMGSASEHTDGMVRDFTRHIVFPRENMIGPSNPDPRPVVSYGPPAPLEENCEKVYPPPETYYMRIITGIGFSTAQKLEAASRYANWLEIRGLNDSALEMYQWGVDIAVRGLTNNDVSIDTSNIVDPKTGSLARSQGVSDNLLRASTSLGVHHARTGNISAALPILLSVLRARREAPISRDVDMEALAIDDAFVSAPSPKISGWLQSIPGVRKDEFTPPPPSGNTPHTRINEKPTCEDAELMLYIGEILFASSSRKSRTSEDEGLSWTRQAVSVAESMTLSTPTTKESFNPLAVLSDPSSVRKSSAELRERMMSKAKCSDCLKTGLANWEAMVKQIQGRPIEDKRGWFGRSNPEVAQTQDVLQDDVARIESLKERLLLEKVNKVSG